MFRGLLDLSPFWLSLFLVFEENLDRKIPEKVKDTIRNFAG